MIYILSIGTNEEPREERLQSALTWLSEMSDECYCSTPYVTAPIGADAGNERKHYLNAVAVIHSDLGETELDARFKEYEISAGRTPKKRADRIVPIDIDIVIADDKIVRPKDFSRYYFRQGYEELRSTLSD